MVAVLFLLSGGIFLGCGLLGWSLLGGGFGGFGTGSFGFGGGAFLETGGFILVDDAFFGGFVEGTLGAAVGFGRRAAAEDL